MPHPFLRTPPEVCLWVFYSKKQPDIINYETFIYEGASVTIGNPAFCRPIRTREIGGVRLTEALYVIDESKVKLLKINWIL